MWIVCGNVQSVYSKTEKDMGLRASSVLRNPVHLIPFSKCLYIVHEYIEKSVKSLQMYR